MYYKIIFFLLRVAFWRGCVVSVSNYDSTRCGRGVCGFRYLLRRGIVVPVCYEHMMIEEQVNWFPDDFELNELDTKW